MLTPRELERRLLDYTRAKLVAPEVAPTVTADTRLFEARVIDSLRILELIAFLEAQLGWKVPDAQVVLANFRTIGVMASVFTGDAPPAVVPRRKSRNGHRVSARQRSATGLDAQNAAGAERIQHPSDTGERIFEHSTGRTRYHPDAVAELVDRGEIEVLEGGEIRFHETALSLSWYFDNIAREWARDLGATETESPEAIKIDTLERAGFVAAFPQKLVMSSEPGRALSPAVCYHSYPRLEGRTLKADGSLTTTVGRCFREETDSDQPLERLRAFTMREIIVVGGRAAVARLREQMIERVSGWVEALGLDGYIEPATDPFFTSDARGRMLTQQLLPLKYELRLGVGGSGRTVAAASFNDHQEHFGRAFDIRLADGDVAHSGCVAFGWERWVLAFVSQHGPDARSWPDIVRSPQRTLNGRSAHASVA